MAGVQTLVGKLAEFQPFIDAIPEHMQRFLPKAIVTEATVLGGNPLSENRESLGVKADFRRRSIGSSNEIAKVFALSPRGIQR